MSTFLDKLKKIIFQHKKGEINIDKLSTKKLDKFLISVLEVNSINEINENDLTKKKLFDLFIKSISHCLISESFNKNQEEIKEIILKNLLKAEGIDIIKTGEDIKYDPDLKTIFSLRKKIISIIKSKPNINTISLINNNEEFFDEDTFINYVFQGKSLVQNFVTKYKIKRGFKFNPTVFDNILQDYQTFNYKYISNLKNYLEKYDIFYQIYNNFATLFKQVQKINNILINKKMEDENISKCLENFYSGFENSAINLGFLFDSKIEKTKKELQESINENSKILNEKYEKISNENSKLYEKLRNEDSKLKNEIKNLKITIENQNKKIIFLENGFKSMTKDLQCPITNEIFKTPYITPYEGTYEESAIKKWIEVAQKDPYSNKALAKKDLIRNVAIKKYS